MQAIEKAILAINRSASAQSAIGIAGIDPRFQLIAALAYIIGVLSLPLTDPGRQVWMLCYPIIMAEASGIGYLRLFAKSLWALPLLIAIGIFNPILDTAPVWELPNFVVTKGMLTFASLVLRGLLTVQALMLLIANCGFYEICRSLQSLKCPKPLVTQLLMLYRYSTVLLQEALSMHRARQSRGYGRKSYPLKMWSVFIGQLLLRSMRRARRVNNAMLARGFNGAYCFAPQRRRLKLADWAFLLTWIAIFLIIHYASLSEMLLRLIHH